MEFTTPLLSGVLMRRYKRFMADIKLDNGQIITAHCPNSGSMKTCKTPGWQVMVSESNNPKRKLKYTWEMVHNGTCWIGINTHLPNKIVVEAIKNKKIPELIEYDDIKTEVKYGQNSRIDILLKKDDQFCYVEIKNVTLVEDGYYQFPDAVTERGQKHLRELEKMIAAGHRAVTLYLIQRSDGTTFKPADHIDPSYGQILRNVQQKGVEILPYQAEVTPEHITLINQIDFIL